MEVNHSGQWKRRLAFYIEDIRDIQPHGPYYLGGTCFGGLVAFEMACILRDQGEEVGLVA